MNMVFVFLFLRQQILKECLRISQILGLWQCQLISGEDLKYLELKVMDQIQITHRRGYQDLYL